jgi:hypothetical protein
MICVLALAFPAASELPEGEEIPKYQQEILKLILFG